VKVLHTFSIAAMLAVFGASSSEAQDQKPSEAQDTKDVTPEPDAWSGFRAALDAEVRYGANTGFIQIPRAGLPGTTDKQEPTYRMIGLGNSAEVFDGQAVLGWGIPDAMLGARFITLTGDNTLARPLASQGTSFPAGERVRGSLTLDIYRLALEASLPARPTADLPFTVKGGVGFALVEQAYQLHGASGEQARRSFGTGAPLFTFDALWVPWGPLGIEGRIMSTVPLRKLPWFFTSDLRVRVRIAGLDDQGPFLFAGSGFDRPEPWAHGLFLYVGIGFDRIETNDMQRAVANHIRAIMGPMFVGGIELLY
jgi:hypothetical protein